MRKFTTSFRRIARLRSATSCHHPQATLTHWDLNWQQPTAILLGNEGADLSPELLAIADTPVKIPLHQGVESLNVAIAAAVILYEAQRQRR
uniref:TrmH family RNA methyltransferase n=1 Tax=Desertifilum tharense IPPAS B-1220 TaxID=1781255 RepID=A0ACD5GS56_9CYAN